MDHELIGDTRIDYEMCSESDAMDIRVGDCAREPCASYDCSDWTFNRQNLTSVRTYSLTYLRLAIPALR